jgi:DSF synthase
MHAQRFTRDTSYRACFSTPLIKEIREFQKRTSDALTQRATNGDTRLAHVVLASDANVFNLGGDLDLFCRLIRARNREHLLAYARQCVEGVYGFHANLNRNTHSIALVQGDALGGGFECALASDVIVAEESAQMGLPEILFNLFPGMGACSLLARRIGMRAAEELILSGRILSASELHRMGVVDVVATDGQGETAVRNWIAKNAKRRNGLQAVFRARQFIHPITREELDGIVGLWVDAAMRLSERDLKMMNRLVRAQIRRVESGQSIVLSERLVAAEAAA